MLGTALYWEYGERISGWWGQTALPRYTVFQSTADSNLVFADRSQALNETDYCDLPLHWQFCYDVVH
jgi:hypothetical protein